MPQQQIDPNRPLTPQQVQQMQAQVGIKSAAQAPAPASQWSTFDQMTGKAPKPAASGGMNLGIEDTAKSGIDTIKSGVSDLFPMFSGANDQRYQQQARDVQNAQRGEAGTGLISAEAQMGENAMHGVAGLGKVVGGIAQTAFSPVLGPVSKLGGAIGEQIGQATPDAPAQKFYELLKNHPEIGKYSTEIMNMANLAFPEALEKGAPAVDAAMGGAKNAASAVADTAAGGVTSVGNAARDAVTPMTPNMQTLIDRVKGDPEAAAKTAADVHSYFDVANKAKGVTGAPTPLDVAGGQFETAMKKLRSNMDTTGKSMKAALKPIANAPVGGVKDILQYLKDQTAERLGSVYTPLAENMDSDAMTSINGMTSAQRYKYLNDVIDGTTASPFSDGEGPLQSAPGRESVLRSPTDIKKISDLHETLANLGENPSIQKVHDVVQRWQGDLYKARQVGAAPIDSNVQGLMKEVIGQLNGTMKDSSLAAEEAGGLKPGTYADAKAKYSDLADLQDDMSERLGEKYKYAPSQIKKIFSPQNNKLNPLIDKLERETGVKIFDHATLADFVMRSVDDPRMRSLLEDAPLTMSKKAITAKIMDFVADKLKDPEGKAIRMLDNKPSMLQSIKDTVGDESGMIKNPFFKEGANMPKQIGDIHPDDIHLMEKFIDHARIKQPLTAGEYAQAETLAQHFGISLDKGLNGVADEFGKILDGTKAGKDTVSPNSITVESAIPRMTPERVYNDLKTSGSDWDRAIESGDIPKEKIYQADGSFTPDAAKHVVSDLGGKMNILKKGLGDQFIKTADFSNPTRENLVKQAQSFLKKNSSEAGFFDPVAMTQAFSQIASKASDAATPYAAMVNPAASKPTKEGTPERLNQMVDKIVPKTRSTLYKFDSTKKSVEPVDADFLASKDAPGTVIARRAHLSAGYYPASYVILNTPPEETDDYTVVRQMVPKKLYDKDARYRDAAKNFSDPDKIPAVVYYDVDGHEYVHKNNSIVSADYNDEVKYHDEIYDSGITSAKSKEEYRARLDKYTKEAHPGLPTPKPPLQLMQWSPTVTSSQ